MVNTGANLCRSLGACPHISLYQLHPTQLRVTSLYTSKCVSFVSPTFKYFTFSYDFPMNVKGESLSVDHSQWRDSWCLLCNLSLFNIFPLGTMNKETVNSWSTSVFCLCSNESILQVFPPLPSLDPEADLLSSEVAAVEVLLAIIL